MNAQPSAPLSIGDWRLDAGAGRLERGAESVRLEARTLRLLLELAARPGEPVSQDELLERVWAGVIVTPDSLYQAIAQLRRLMGDDPRKARYIATVPRLGYRLVAPVSPWNDAAPGLELPRRRGILLVAGAVALALAASAVWAILEGPARTLVAAVSPATVGVLPFLDLTPDMDQLPLADDVSEGIVDQLSRNPRLRVPGFRASFLLRGKHASLKEAARTLGVAYTVEGSMRRVGPRMRVVARLVRADTGFIVWSQAYDRPITDLPHMDAEIAASVGQALGRR